MSGDLKATALARARDTLVSHIEAPAWQDRARAQPDDRVISELRRLGKNCPACMNAVIDYRETLGTAEDA